MKGIYILAVFGEYMEDWKNAIENNSSWQRTNGRYESNKHGFTLAMRFSEQLNVTIYECCVTTENGARIADLESFHLEHAWNVMWGKKNIQPSHITIYTREDYSDFLLKTNWKQEQEGSRRIVHNPTRSIYECDEEGTFNYLSADHPGTVQNYLKQLAAIGFPINQKYLANVG